MHMILHKASSRGVAEHGWLLSHHTFSFANYFNPERMGFGVLRVINDDVVTPSMGFDTHAHQNMEIISIPLKGSLKHSDTMGNDFVIKKNEIQVMSAGIGVSHSEYNNSAEEDVNFLQIWVLPKKKDVYPNYSQKEFFEDDRLDKFQLIVSPDGRGDSLQINQDAYFSLIKLSKDKSAIYSKYKKDNGVYFFVIEGNISINENDLENRDGLGVEDKDDLKIISSSEGEILIIEVPMLERLEG
ncbi:MAG: pirin family protein [Bdellovibrionota bacterium]